MKERGPHTLEKVHIIHRDLQSLAHVFLGVFVGK